MQTAFDGPCDDDDEALFVDDFPEADPDRVRPFVYEDERGVAMHFEISSIQSRMRRDDPYALDLDYTRAMMGFLLFVPEPRSLLMVGLGGGSLAKYCHRHFEHCDITVAEINPHVIALRDDFLVPPESARFRVLCTDGAALMSDDGLPAVEVLLVDGFNHEGQPEQLCTQRFYDDCRARLAEGGVMVANLHADHEQCAAIVERIERAFDGRLVVVGAEAGGNLVVFAGRDCPPPGGAQALRRRLEALPEPHRQTLRAGAGRLLHAVASRSSTEGRIGHPEPTS